MSYIDQVEAERNMWKARYMAAHDVLLHVEDFCENFLTPEGTIFMDRFFAMRAAFLAYRAAVEAGAPLGWAVAEEQQLPNAEAQRGRGAEEGQR